MTTPLCASPPRAPAPSDALVARSRTAGLACALGLLFAFGANLSVADAAITDEVFERDGYRLHVTNQDPALSDEIIGDLVHTFFTVYPALRDDLNPSAPVDVRFTFVTDHPYPASANGDEVTFHSKHMINNPLDWDIVTHEVMHVLQAPAYGPSWIIEGIADYARDLYGINNDVSGWRLNDEPGRYYSAGYGHTALFFIWVEQNHYPALVQDMTRTLLAGQYTEATWAELTGFTVEELWDQYRPGFPIPTEAATFFEHTEYGGSFATLGVGSYTLADLEARGVANDWVSSLWVPAGLEVQLFSDDGFGGTQLTLTSSIRSLPDFGANDTLSSVIIRRR